MLEQYFLHREERAAIGLPPLPMDSSTVTAVIDMVKAGQGQEKQAELIALLSNCVPAGVDDAARVKALFLSKVAQGAINVDGIKRDEATRLLGTMRGGYNVPALIALLDDDEIGPDAALALEHTILIYHAFHDVASKAEKGHPRASQVISSWAEAEWFTSRPAVPDTLELTVFKVPGETNTDDLSPASDVFTRTDIPLHASAMLKNPHVGLQPDIPGIRGPLATLDRLRSSGRTIAFVGDLVGTGSSRKSAVNSLQWHMGADIPFIPNKREGGVCLATRFAPIFFSTVEDAGGLPITIDVSSFAMGDALTLMPHAGLVLQDGREHRFVLDKPTLLDSVRAGGRIQLIIGRGLTERARSYVGSNSPSVFVPAAKPTETPNSYTLAQKLVGRACGLPEGRGVVPGAYCEPRIDAIASPDDSGPLTRNELKDLACMGFAADLVLQTFCHTAAYPNATDLQVQRELPGFMRLRGGVALKPGDGVIHSWLNRMLLPDRIGTGADSHTRFPLGISFPAGSGMVAFAAATGVMPMEMPESVLVRFRGTRRPGITVRDLVHAIPLFARRAGLLTLEKQNKVNVFNGRILEIAGLSGLSVQEAFELTDATAERSSTATTIELDHIAVREHLKEGLELLRGLIDAGYESKATLERRLSSMTKWLEQPEPLLRADDDAPYAAVLEIDLALIGEPIVCCPNDPDDARFLSEVAPESVHEVFLGSCMTNATHFQKASRLLRGQGPALPKLWIAPPTRMDEEILKAGGDLDVFSEAGSRNEIPGCSLCMGNQARVADGATVVSTSTRNFPHRMGLNARVYLASAEVAALSARLGRLPSSSEYFDAVRV